MGVGKIFKKAIKAVTKPVEGIIGAKSAIRKSFTPKR
ncbi:host range and adsorption protein [Yersinia phage vB_YpEc11]|uniref:Host range and adsorption protein n=1 Tax=Yersinia phage vB_YpEc11 TaxID=3056113 RepID=A0AA51VHD7_9CAUD|nr:host range and adsorption protein [Yersinia phage vB_YpEc11]